MVDMPHGWIQRERIGDFALVKRRFESAVVHVHNSHIRGDTVHVCEWTGDYVKCLECGREQRVQFSAGGSRED